MPETGRPRLSKGVELVHLLVALTVDNSDLDLISDQVLHLHLDFYIDHRLKAERSTHLLPYTQGLNLSPWSVTPSVGSTPQAGQRSLWNSNWSRQSSTFEPRLHLSSVSRCS